MNLVKYSDYCGVHGCDGFTEIALAVVQNLNGRRLVDACSRFVILDKNDSPVIPIEVKPEYIFKSWITRCADCYGRDADRFNHELATNPEKRTEYIESRRSR